METLKKLMELLKGKKTYLATIGLGILGLLWSEQVVSDDTAKIVGTVLATMAGISLRAGMNHAANENYSRKEKTINKNSVAP